MTVRELINKLMDMDLDKPIHLCELTNDNTKCIIGYPEIGKICESDYKIIDVDIHGIYGTFLNCITIGK